MTTFSKLKGKQDSLLFAALDCLVLIKPYDGTFPEAITEADGSLRDLYSEGFRTIGEFQKSEGVGLTFDKEVDGPEGYGSRGKRRYIISSEGINLSVTAQERSEEHTSELQSRLDLVCRLLLEKTNSLEYRA